MARKFTGDAEHFWQKRYYDLTVRNHRQFIEKSQSREARPL